MPLWNIYCSANAFDSAEARDAFAATITASYAALPAFYVVVNFIALDDSHCYRSGKRVSTLSQPFVRLVISHLARHAKDSADIQDGYAKSRAVVDRAIQEHIVDKSYLWEYTITEDSRDLWKIDGHIPPPFDSDAMKEWKRNDRASAY